MFDSEMGPSTGLDQGSVLKYCGPKTGKRMEAVCMVLCMCS